MWLAHSAGVPGVHDKTDHFLDELRVMILGSSTSAYVTFCSHARPVGQFLRVYGTKNTVHVDFMLRTMLVDQFQTIPTSLGRLLPPFKSSWKSLGQATRNVREFAASRYHFFEGMNRLLSLFYESILHDTPSPSPTPKYCASRRSWTRFLRRFIQGS